MLRIGILSRNLTECSNWELKLYDEIHRNSNLTLEVFFFEKVTYDESRAIFKRRTNLIGRVLYHLQRKIESYMFPAAHLYDREAIIGRLSQVKSERLVAVRRGYVDRFDSENVKKVSEWNLDVILRHAFNIIRGDILRAARYGIWSLHHGDNRINRGGPPGIWEVLYGQKFIGVTLQILRDELDAGQVIGKSFYNVHWSMEKNRKVAYEGSVSLVLKNLICLEKTGEVVTSKSPLYYYPLLRVPRLRLFIRYIIHFYSSLLLSIASKFISMTGLRRRNVWQLYLSEGKFLDSSLYKAKAISIPKGEFWADPFMLTRDGYDYIFFERYFYKTQRGCIACAKINDGEVVELENVVFKKYHMSYPCLFEDSDRLYMIPETADNNRLEVYICVDFPYKWELYSTAFHGEKLLDPTLYRDENNQLWLFANRVNKFGDMDNSELHIYRIDSLNFNTIEPHNQNPVLLDSSIARNAGSIIRYNDEIYRPSQANIEGVYGRALNLNRIEMLDLDDYKETNTHRAWPHFEKGLSGIHHVHQKSNKFVFDVCRK